MSQNQFEFMRNITFGQYLPLNSFLHRLDPRVRLLMALFLVIPITVTRSPWGLLCGACLVMAGLLAGKIPFGFALRGLLPPIPFLLILAVLQILFFATPPGSVVLFVIWKINITDSGLISAGMLLLRFMVLILVLSLASFTMSTNEVIRGLEALLRPFQTLKLPVHDIVLAAQVTLRYLPILAQTAENIAKAQASRGADWDNTGNFRLVRKIRNILPIIVPLFLISLRKAESLALAMDARGYGLSNRRTSRIELKYKTRDLVCVWVVGLISLALLFI